MKTAFALFLLGLACSQTGLAEETETYLGAADCKIGAVHPVPEGELSWKGKCLDGYAQGQGALAWFANKGKKYRLEAVLVRGAIQGEAKLDMPDGGRYIGTFAGGLPDGTGYFKDPDGMRYEGEVHGGRREGVAEGVFPNGNHYKGEWKDGKPDGTGRMEYMLGGAYEGEWTLGKRQGKGSLTYAGSGRTYVGRFVDDRIEGAAPPPQMDGKYSLKEKAGLSASFPRREVARGSQLPLDVGYDRFTPEQKRLFNDSYAALEEGDEPPYPLQGQQEFFTLMSKLTGRYELREDVLIFVLVGADGHAESVTVRGLENPELRRIAGTAAGLIQYKPARCRGAPCKMMFPYHLRLRVSTF